jgi:hypothetical protein
MVLLVLGCASPLRNYLKQGFQIATANETIIQPPPSTPRIAGPGLHPMPTNPTAAPSTNQGPSYHNSKEAFKDDVPLIGVDFMEQTTEFADTFYSQAG